MGVYPGLHRRAGIEIGTVIGDSMAGHLEVFRVDFDANAVSAPFGAGKIC
jgi:hypothetical protein